MRAEGEYLGLLAAVALAAAICWREFRHISLNLSLAPLLVVTTVVEAISVMLMIALVDDDRGDRRSARRRGATTTIFRPPRCSDDEN